MQSSVVPEQISKKLEKSSKIVEVKYEKSNTPSPVIKQIPLDYDSSLFKLVSTLFW